MKNTYLNVFWQLVAQFFNLLIPLLTLKLILLNSTFIFYGEISLILAIIGFSRVIIDLGFNIKGPSILFRKTDISNHKSTVVCIFVLRLLFSLLISIMVSILVFIFRQELYLIYLIVPIIITSAFNLNYLYNFYEKSQYISFISFSEKSILLCLIYFCFIDNINNFNYLLSLSVACIISCSCNIIIFLFYFKGQSININMIKIKLLMFDSLSQLKINIINSIYTFSIIPLVTIFMGSYEAGIYSTGEKVIKAFQIISQPIINGFQKFFLSKKRKETLKIYYINFAIIIMIMIITINFASDIALFLSDQNIRSISQVIKITSIAIVSSYCLSFANVHIFSVNNYEKTIAKQFGLILIIFSMLLIIISPTDLLQFSWIIFWFEFSLIFMVFKNLILTRNA